jgi:hypothetical protein
MALRSSPSTITKSADSLSIRCEARTAQNERIGRMVIVVRLPDLSMGDLGEFESGKHKRHFSPNAHWLRL